MVPCLRSSRNPPMRMREGTRHLYPALKCNSRRFGQLARINLSKMVSEYDSQRANPASFNTRRFLQNTLPLGPISSFSVERSNEKHSRTSMTSITLYAEEAAGLTNAVVVVARFPTLGALRMRSLGAIRTRFTTATKSTLAQPLMLISYKSAHRLAVWTESLVSHY
jgi:hypothetical protein